MNSSSTRVSPMASAISSTPSYTFHTSSSVRIPSLCFSCSSSYLHSYLPNTPKFPQLGLTNFPQWSGLRQLGIPISQPSFELERRRKCRGKVVVASLFGVGAPEALVIGVVALLVFGPKGLAEVARNLGKTLRAFQPTIRELQEVSREFKTSLEKEIGLDELQNPMQGNYSSTTTTPFSRPTPVATPDDPSATVDPNGSPSLDKAYSSEDYLKITEEQLKASAALQQKEQATSSPADAQLESQSQEAQDTVQVEAATPPVQTPKSES